MGASIAEALAKAAPGTTLQLAPGVYREAVVITRSGAEGAPITLRGSVSPTGEKLTRITTSVPLEASAWKPAPEVGPGVYRYSKPLAFKAARLTANGRQIAPIHPLTGGGGIKERPLTARQVLAWPEDHQINTQYTARYVAEGLPFWKTMTAISYFEEEAGKEQAIYLRFAGGTSPAEYEIEAYPDGSAIILDNAQYVSIVDLAITGGASGVVVSGKEAKWNEVRNCDIFFGKDRVLLTGGSSHNVIRDCRIEMRFFGPQTGAWAGAESIDDAAARKAAAVRCFIYIYYKYWASAHSVSDNRSISLKNTSHNLIWNNEVNGGLIGISLVDTSDILIQGNRVLHHSSVGTSLRANATRVQYDRNYFEDNGINFRLHDLNGDVNRLAWLTNNTSILPDKLGNHIFCHVYLKRTKIEPETSPEVYFLNNTFRGGRYGLRLPHPTIATNGVPKFVLAGNLFAINGSAVSGRTLVARNDGVGAFDYNLVIQSPDEEVPSAQWYGQHNVVAPQEGGVKPTPPDFSQPFQLNGKTFAPVPLMEAVSK